MPSLWERGPEGRPAGDLPGLRRADGSAVRPMPFRAFVAVDLPTSDPLEALSRALRTSGASLKLVDLGQLHSTLKFLGETEEGLVPDIVSIVRDASRAIAPFEIHLTGTGAFPSLTRMNVVWVGLTGAEPLGQIAAALDHGLERLGFRRERRPWAPHVTLARVKGGRNLDRVRQILQAHASDAFGRAHIDAVRLKKSVLTPAGALYSDVNVVELRA